ncbi:hypothetical protein HTZ84_09380 [Haloterrigena sp. SYSU A558-1]|uniref:Uncharacterized protein n=1 Tax=Haloterrigena gelatinilytica TaxID=2741724 RepID=A0ABX2LF96_9EURY|nr:hypothetical protein [Haloterrigena gelatinilytica]NUC72516.1 hypothetical protein [Haloterrigena gelatinilytica]
METGTKHCCKRSCCKEVVDEGVTRIPESYFDITEITTLDGITSELDRNLLGEQNGLSLSDEVSELADVDLTQLNTEQPGRSAVSDARHGFDYEVDGDTITGRYVYTDVQRDITPNGQVERLVSEGSIPFRIIPHLNLLIVETTSVIDVQKTKSAFNKNTNMDIVVCGDITAVYEDAPEMMDTFRSSFADQDGDPDEPKVLGTDVVQLYNPHGDSENEVKKIDLEGQNIAGHPLIEERLEDDYIIKGLTTTIDFEDSIFEVAVAGTGTMGYAKIEGVGEYEKGQRLMNEVRSRYLRHLRTR